MDVVISKNIRKAIGLIDDIYKKNAEALNAGLKNIKEGMDENFEIVNLNLEQISGTLDVLNSNIVTGFQLLFVKVDELNTSLAHLSRGIDTLIEIARTPVQTWAFNQYEIACDMVRRRLFPEALEALTFAIDGKDQHTGYKSEFRFHRLRGVVLSGTPGGSESIEVLNLKAAEDSFIVAARYARHDHPTEAAQAFIGAGRSAYVDGRLLDAEKWYQDALKLDHQCAEANYQMARLSLHAENPSQVESYLCKALYSHWSFAMRASADGLFVEHQQLVRKCVESVAQTIADEIRPRLGDITLRIQFLREKQI